MEKSLKVVKPKFPTASAPLAQRVDDVLDIWDGTSQDSNNDGVLDECECFADVNGDGAGNVLDILMLLENWGQTGPIGDTTNDGTVNVDDILYILDNWGACT